MPAVTPNVVLIRHTLSPEETVALGAKLCYSRAGVDDLLERVSAKDPDAEPETVGKDGFTLAWENDAYTFSKLAKYDAGERIP